VISIFTGALVAESRFGEFHDISVHHLAHAVCGFDNSEVLVGRPYGGCCILWRRNMLGIISLLQLSQSAFVQ